jgi:YD repeat-containing protein
VEVTKVNRSAFFSPSWFLLYLSILIFDIGGYQLSASGESVTYQYDTLNRLTSATYPGSITIGYTYDTVGNRLTEVTTAAAALMNTEAEASISDSAANAVRQSGVGIPHMSSTFETRLDKLADVDNSNSRISKRVSTGAKMGGETGEDSNMAARFYEDAEDGFIRRWAIADGPTGAYINNVYAPERESRVILLTGEKLLNSFLLQTDEGTQWNDTDHQVIQWSMKCSNDFVVSVAAETNNGLRFLSFIPSGEDALGSGTDVFYGLGIDSMDGQWHTYCIDLREELREAQPDTTILSLHGFFVRGSGQFDDVRTLKKIQSDQNVIK